MRKGVVTYIFLLIAVFAVMSCERNEFIEEQDTKVLGTYIGELVQVPCNLELDPFAVEGVKSQDYKVNELQVQNFWLLQFGEIPDGEGKSEIDRPFLAAIYHPHVNINTESGTEIETDLAKNYVMMAGGDYLEKTKEVWIVANIGQTDINGIPYFKSYPGKTLGDFFADGFPLSEINQLRSLNGGNTYMSKPEDGLVIPLSGGCSFNSLDLKEIDDKKGLVVKLKAIVAKLTIDVSNVAYLQRVKLMRVPSKVSYAPEKVNLNVFKNLYYDYIVEDYTVNKNAAKTVTLYIPQNLQQNSVFPDEQIDNGTAATKTKNAPAKATYISLEALSGTKSVSINVFPGGIDNTYTDDEVGDNSIMVYDIAANTHYTEIIQANADTYTNYLGDETNDSRIIERIQYTVTSNCYILNPIVTPGDNIIKGKANFNVSQFKEEYYSLPIVARVNEASGASKVSIGEKDEWRVEVLWQDVPGRQIYFAESSGLKGWNNEGDGPVDHIGSLDSDNPSYAHFFYGYGNSLKDGSVNIFVNKETQKVRTAGNVLIALRKRKADASGYGDNAYGPIIWSWHLWVTDYNPDAAGDWSSGNYHKGVPGDDGGNGARDAKVMHYNAWGSNYKWIMDRHLGALGWRPMNVKSGTTFNSYGLYYQWGRKDPFPAQRLLNHKQNVAAISLYNIRGNKTDTDINIAGISSSSTTEGDIWLATNNPTMLYSNSVITTFKGSVNSNYNWNHPNGCQRQGTKSILDPCPPGWEVPESDAYACLVTTLASNLQNNWANDAYATEFHKGAAEPSDKTDQISQLQVNDGAWLIDASGNSGNTDTYLTYFPCSGWLGSNGFVDRQGIGDIWCAEQKTDDLASFMYIGYGVETADNNGVYSFTRTAKQPSVVVKVSGDSEYYFKKHNGFSVRCVKK